VFDGKCHAHILPYYMFQPLWPSSGWIQHQRKKNYKIYGKGKGKAVPLQAWTGPEGSSKLGFPDFVTTAQDVGKVVSLTHQLPLPPGNTPGTHFWLEADSTPRAIVRLEGFYINITWYSTNICVV